MATLQVYEEMGKHVEKEIIGNNIIPQLWHLALGPNLKPDQVRFVAVVCATLLAQ